MPIVNELGAKMSMTGLGPRAMQTKMRMNSFRTASTRCSSLSNSRRLMMKALKASRRRRTMKVKWKPMLKTKGASKVTLEVYRMRRKIKVMEKAKAMAMNHTLSKM